MCCRVLSFDACFDLRRICFIPAGSAYLGNSSWTGFNIALIDGKFIQCELVFAWMYVVFGFALSKFEY